MATLVAQQIGWPLLPLPDARGELHFPTLEESVRQSIKVILQTRPGEQLMRQEFGGGLERFVNEPNNLTTQRRIRDLVLESLARWEPRIVVDRVEVAEVPNRPSHLSVQLMYRLKRTGAAGQMGLTMILDS
jgi:phage baseplate assembly protein W